MRSKPSKAYGIAYANLYGTECPRPIKAPPKKRKRRINWEEMEQIKLATWLTKENILFYAIPNGGSRHPWEAVNLKRSGVRSGVPDLCIPIPMASKGLNSLYIELKRKDGGSVSENQKYWLSALNSLGHRAVVANGFDEAKKIVMDYFGKI
jgi:VRR-NUC domain